MAFNEAAKMPPVIREACSGRDQPPLEDLGTALQSFQQGVTKLSRLVDALERPDGPRHVRYQLDVVGDVASRLGRELRECGLQSSETALCKARHSKLSKDYRVVNQRFESIRGKALAKLNAGGRLAEHVIDRTSPYGDGRAVQDSAERDEDLRLRMQLQEEAINEEILRERDQEIQEIHLAASQVNEVFKDLADIVADQQQEIDAVQSMIERSHHHAQSGLEHVEKASEAADSGPCSLS